MEEGLQEHLGEVVEEGHQHRGHSQMGREEEGEGEERRQRRLGQVHP